VRRDARDRCGPIGPYGSPRVVSDRGRASEVHAAALIRYGCFRGQILCGGKKKEKKKKTKEKKKNERATPGFGAPRSLVERGREDIFKEVIFNRSPVDDGPSTSAGDMGRAHGPHVGASRWPEGLTEGEVTHG